MAEVLDLLGFVPCERSGDQVRGPCPVHRSATCSGRSFSANIQSNIYRCFKCGSSGNHLDLYAAVTGLSLFNAAVTLCGKLPPETPWACEAGPTHTVDRGPSASHCRAPERTSASECHRRRNREVFYRRAMWPVNRPSRVAVGKKPRTPAAAFERPCV